MNGETPGPVPTRLVFLSEILSVATGSKIRFLGCVSKYEVSTGTLILEHNYPLGAPEPAVIDVDINLLLETVKTTDLQVGAWLNVLGYVRYRSSAAVERGSATSPLERRSIYVEAVMIWAAGAIRIGEYERVLRDCKEVDRRVRVPV